MEERTHSESLPIFLKAQLDTDFNGDLVQIKNIVILLVKDIATYVAKRKLQANFCIILGITTC